VYIPDNQVIERSESDGKPSLAFASGLWARPTWPTGKNSIGVVVGGRSRGLLNVVFAVSLRGVESYGLGD